MGKKPKNVEEENNEETRKECYKKSRDKESKIKTNNSYVTLASGLQCELGGSGTIGEPSRIKSHEDAGKFGKCL